MSAAQPRLPRRLLRLIAVPLAVLPALSACAVGTDDAGGADNAAVSPTDSAGKPPQVAAPTASTSSQLLAQISYSKTHTLRFVEPSPGLVAIEEQRNADTDQGAVVTQAMAEGKTLSEIFQAADPNHATAPEALKAAERRAAERLAASTQAPQNAPANAAAPESGAAASETSTAFYDGWDWVGDERWFLQNFCTQGERRSCLANYYWLYSGQTGYVQWAQFTGFDESMTETAHFYGTWHHQYWDWFTWHDEWPLAFNVTMQPRTLLTYTFGAGNYTARIESAYPNGRVGLATLVNTVRTSSYSPPHINAPCSNMGDFCCPGTATSNSYCSGGVTCTDGVLCR